MILTYLIIVVVFRFLFFFHLLLVMHLSKGLLYWLIKIYFMVLMAIWTKCGPILKIILD